MEYAGWLLDVYASPVQEPGVQDPEGSAQGGVLLWLLGEDGERRLLHQPFSITFYIAGPEPGLRAVRRFLENQPIPLSVLPAERRDLFRREPLPVLAVRVAQPGAQPRLFKQVLARFPDLTYYDADISLPLRYAAAHGVFPLAHCRVSASKDGQVESITALDSPWDIDPPPPPVRTLTVKPDSNPFHSPPSCLDIRSGRCDYRLSLEPERAFLVGLRAILQRHDPDLLLTSWGDTWLLPYLLERARQRGIPLPLNRDPGQPVLRREARSYFSYGQIIHQGQQVHLFGRWHLDIFNAMLFHDYGLDGVYELARVTGLPVQVAARSSPGTGISAMQILTALRQGILVPWHKQQAEHPKTALDLLHADQGGLVGQPIVGLHHDVAEIDFISMYPSIMVRFNVSPETAGSSQSLARTAFKLKPMEAELPGLVPQTLRPLLEKRLALKNQLAFLPRWHPNYKRYKARASSHKWLLVTCFGYLGYKNARFGRIEAHETVTSYGREALLRAKEAAEEQGCTVLHLYVDGLWLSKPGGAAVADFQPLLDEIVERTGLPVALDGIYRWIAFLPSRQDPRLPVANRYFGAFRDGSLKLRGIEARRRDTPPFIAQAQMAILQELSGSYSGSPESLPAGKILSLLRARLQMLRAGRLPLEDLLVAQKLSRVVDEYRTPSPVARAVVQLEEAGKSVRPGQVVRFLYTRGKPGVHAWDLPEPPEPAGIDVERYSTLLLRAAGTVLSPFGISEERLRSWLFSNAAYAAPPGALPAAKESAQAWQLAGLPLWENWPAYFLGSRGRLPGFARKHSKSRR